MSIRNRELSQFGSFISINDDNKNISIASGIANSVGIGTSTPTEKLHVAGNTKIDGNLEVGGTFNFDFNGFLLEGDVDINTTGIITAGKFISNEGILTISDRWDKSGDIVYRIQGNIGIGLSNPVDKLDVSGNIRAPRFISTNTTTGNTPPFTISSSDLVQNLNADFLRGGIPGSNLNSNDIVTLGNTQTLTNKTLTTPIFGSGGVTFSGISGNTVLRSNTNASGTLLLPVTDGTLVSTGDTGVITSNMIADLNITNVDVAIGASISYSKLNLTNSIINSDIANGTIQNTKLVNNTISGVSLGSSLNTLTRGSYLTGSNYNGSSATTWAVDATTSSTANKVVARGASGEFSASSITLTNDLTATSGTVSARTLSALTGGLSVTGSTSLGAGLTVTGSTSLSGTSLSGITSITSTENSTSTSTGALRVSGGVGIAKTLTVGEGFRLSGSFRDVNNSVGTAGSVLSSTGSFVEWIPSSTFPTGGIILWSGSTTSIPTGWALCNGSNGTPDLRDRFIVGSGTATDGSTYKVGNSGNLGGFTGGTQMPYYSLAYIMKL